MAKCVLKNAIRERGLTVKSVAKQSGIFQLMLYLGIWGIMELTLDEIRRIAEVLGLNESETAQIFFGENVS